MPAHPSSQGREKQVFPGIASILGFRFSGKCGKIQSMQSLVHLGQAGAKYGIYELLASPLCSISNFQ
jgi:hypothetical protein